MKPLLQHKAAFRLDLEVMIYEFRTRGIINLETIDRLKASVLGADKTYGRALTLDELLALDPSPDNR